MAGCAETDTRPTTIMSHYKEEGLINVLVLGSSNIKISYFVKLFSAYLKYDTYEELVLYGPNFKTEVENVEEISGNAVQIGIHNFQFINTAGLQKSNKNYKDILNILLHFKKGYTLHAIILLIDHDKKDNENYFEQYAVHFFSGMKQYAKNILYVISYNGLCMCNHTYSKLQKAFINLSPIVTYESNVLHLNEETFYKHSGSNWEESVKFCTDVLEHITGSGLKSFYVQFTMPAEESFLNLLYNLMEILVEVYFFAEYDSLNKMLYSLYGYDKNVTACYGENCFTWKSINGGYRLKTPKICHENCNCSQSILNIGNCSVFEASKNCSVCNCDIASHHRNIFNKELSPSVNVSQEKSIVMSILARLFLFAKTYTSTTFSIENFISKELKGYLGYDKILQTLITDFERELNIYSKFPITTEKVLMCISKLYEIKQLTSIIPDVINENIPEGLRLEVISEAQGKTIEESGEVNCWKTELQKVKVENENIREEMKELKLRLDQILNCSNTNNLSNLQCDSKIQNDKFNVYQDGEENADK